MIDVALYRACGRELQKLAISAGTTLSLLQQRAAQGARIAPKLMQGAEQAAAQGLAHTPSAARRAALGAGEAVRASQATQMAGQNPVTQAMRGRVLGAYEQGVSSSAVRDTSKLLPHHYDYGATGMAGSLHPYTQEHINSMMGSANVVDPKGLAPTITGRQPSMMHPTPPMGASGVTQVSPFGATQIAPSALDRTQAGLVGGKSLGEFNQGVPHFAPAERSGTVVAKRPRVAA